VATIKYNAKKDAEATLQNGEQPKICIYEHESRRQIVTREGREKKEKREKIGEY
jgi:hypothetical protein